MKFHTLLSKLTEMCQQVGVTKIISAPVGLGSTVIELKKQNSVAAISRLDELVYKPATFDIFILVCAQKKQVASGGALRPLINKVFTLQCTWFCFCQFCFQMRFFRL